MSDVVFSTLDCTNRIANNQEGDQDRYAQEEY
jgi:hypothetical protein